jgi:hypothetical protein
MTTLYLVAARMTEEDQTAKLGARLAKSGLPLGTVIQADMS